MPRRPHWFSRLDEIVELVEQVPIPFVDRETFGHLFNIQRTAAAYWMRKFGGVRVGTGTLVEKRVLLIELCRYVNDPGYVRESRRRVRLEEKLEEARRETAARKVKVPYSGETPARIEGLAENIHLTAGRLEIEFHGTEDLLRALYELSQAAARDYLAFQKACGD